MKFISRIIKGAGNLPGYGLHPGTDMLIFFVLMGGLAGSKGGWWGVLGGAAFMFVMIGALWCIGAHDRAKSYEKDHEQS